VPCCPVAIAGIVALQADSAAGVWDAGGKFTQSCRISAPTLLTLGEIPGVHGRCRSHPLDAAFMITLS
jgi:hypothetical protein